MLGLRNRDTCREIFKKHELLTVASIYIYELLKLTKLHEDEIRTFKRAHQYNTRNNCNIQLSSIKSATVPLSAVSLGARCYNKLPKPLKELDNAHAFLKSVKKLLVEGAYYTVQEFLEE